MRLVVCVGWFLAFGGVVGAVQPRVDFDYVIDAFKDTGTWQASATHKFDYRPEQRDGWAPYRDGQWVYTDYGWTWQGADRGSWMTDHYGYWTRRDGDGGQRQWVWVPGGFWLPATVEWLRSGDYLGWRASRLDRFSNTLESEATRYGDPAEWNFVLADKIRGPLTADDFAPPAKAKELLVSAQPVDHVFVSYREIDRPGPDPAILQPVGDGQRQVIIPDVTDLPALDARPEEPAAPRKYCVYRPKFYQDEDGIFRRVELFLNPRVREQVDQMTQTDAEAANQRRAAEKKREELLESRRQHQEDLYR
ncbi:MAG: hypothetical protein LBK71_00010 [Verrucomicrobiales bacterium]|jgi:hypothetical protein|nr:hypothetical protein [Verrucomicrobiales bacterium]